MRKDLTMVTSASATIADLMALEAEDRRYELIEGELVGMSPAQPEHAWIESQLHVTLALHVTRRGFGYAFASSLGYQLFDDPPTVVAPDVSFIRADRYPDEFPDGYLRVVPDFVAEIRSPSERRGEIDRKIRLYLAAGVRMVVYIDPPSRSMTVYRPGREPMTLQETDVLDGDDVIPGFRMVVGSVFRARRER
jgi:Uma2 family endonuclease